MSNSAKILVVDDEHSVRWAFEKALQKACYQVFLAETGAKGLALFESVLPDLTLLDIRMPEMDGLQVLKKIREKHSQAKVIVMTAYSDMETTVTAMKMGAYDFLTKPFNIDDCLALIAKGLQTPVSEGVAPAKVLPSKTGVLIGNSACMQEVYKLIGKVSAEDVTVLITGESGSGKELVAQAIHYNSNRSEKPFWALNCTAVTETLMESELFGYEKGAFTGANVSKPGVFELAHGGTLFLDEIGDMSLEMQAQVLRVLEEREIVRVGGNKRIKVDVRLITATNKNLRKAIQEHQFREDLFHRIKVIEIRLPPLRERVDDIPLLANYFVALFATQRKGVQRTLSGDVIKALQAYDWPGNVRELRNTIDQAYTLCRNSVIQLEDLPPEVRGGKSHQASLPSQQPLTMDEKVSPVQEISGEKIIGSLSAPPSGHDLIRKFVEQHLKEELDGTAYEVIMDYLEKELILQALAMFKGNQVQTANYLGITRNTLRTKISKYGI